MDNSDVQQQLATLSHEVLSSSSFFKAFSSKDISALAPFSNIQFFQKGEVIIQQGSSNDFHIFFLLMGKVVVHIDNKYILSLERPWDIFGEMSICSDAPRSATVIADELVQVLSIDAAVLHNPKQQEDYQIKYYFYNMFASILSWKLQVTSDRAKLYEDQLLKVQKSEKYSQGLEQQLQNNLEQTLLYSHVVNSTHEGIIILDLSGIVTMSNPATDRLFDNEEVQIIGVHIKQFIVIPPELPLNIDDILTQGKTADGWSGELEFLHEDHAFPIHLSISSVSNHQKDIIALSCIIRDISKQKEYESQILKQQQELQEAYFHLKTLDTLKTDFLTLMSHEFRTPLSAILGYSETLLEPSVTQDEQKAFLSSIYTEAKRLDKLLRNVLNLSKLESGKLYFSFTSNDIHETIRMVVEEFIPQIESKGLTLSYDITTSSKVFCLDKERIAEVLEHLLENAMQFTEQGKIEVGICHDSHKSTIWVSDTGIGIAEENYEKVFKKFELIEEMAAHHRGLGIGMPLSYYIVKEHFGSIWIESELGKESTFYFNLPHDLENGSEDDEDFSFLL